MRKPVQIVLATAVVLLVIVAAVLFGQYQKTSKELTVAKSGQTEAEGRYAETIDAIAEIQDSLNSIALGDTGLGVQPWNPQTGQEAMGPKGKEALSRIAAVRSSIARSKERIQALEARVKQNGIKLGSLQRMIKNLKRDVAEKEQMVAQLQTQVTDLNTQVVTLNTTVQETQDTLRVRDETLEQKRRELATVYYIVGTKSDLKNAGVVQSKGGLLGIGKTLTPTPVPASSSAFTAMDTDQQTVIYTPSKKVRVITAQPVTSYQLMLVDGKMELHITDPTEFRKIKQVVILAS